MCWWFFSLAKIPREKNKKRREYYAINWYNIRLFLWSFPKFLHAFAISLLPLSLSLSPSFLLLWRWPPAEIASNLWRKTTRRIIYRRWTGVGENASKGETILLSITRTHHLLTRYVTGSLKSKIKLRNNREGTIKWQYYITSLHFRLSFTVVTFVSLFSVLQILVILK